MPPLSAYRIFLIANDSVIARRQRVAQVAEAPQTAIASYNFRDPADGYAKYVSYWHDSDDLGIAASRQLAEVLRTCQPNDCHSRF